MNSYRFIRFIVLSAVLVLISSGLFFAGDPVPGIDISLEEVPGGIIKRGTTNRNGEVTFNNLRPGDYKITFVDLKKIKNYNSSKSNTASTSIKGRTEWEVNITLIKDGGMKTPDEPIYVTIGPNGGKIKIRFDREVGIKEEGVK